MALCSGHVTLLFSRCLSSSPVIEVNEVTENIPNFELQNLRLCALNRILFLKGNVSELPGGASALAQNTSFKANCTDRGPPI